MPFLILYFIFIQYIFFACNILSIARRQPVTQASHCQRLLNVIVVHMTINSWILIFGSRKSYRVSSLTCQDDDISQYRYFVPPLCFYQTTIWYFLFRKNPYLYFLVLWVSGIMDKTRDECIDRSPQETHTDTHTDRHILHGLPHSAVW